MTPLEKKLANKILKEAISARQPLRSELIHEYLYLMNACKTRKEAEEENCIPSFALATGINKEKSE